MADCGRSLGYYAEVPGVICDIQAHRPSTAFAHPALSGCFGFAYTLSHGDHQALWSCCPARSRQCYEFARAAFDYDRRFPRLRSSSSPTSTLGMNLWMNARLPIPLTSR